MAMNHASGLLRTMSGTWRGAGKEGVAGPGKVPREPRVAVSETGHERRTSLCAAQMRCTFTDQSEFRIRWNVTGKPMYESSKDKEELGVGEIINIESYSATIVFGSMGAARLLASAGTRRRSAPKRGSL